MKKFIFPLDFLRIFLNSDVRLTRKVITRRLQNYMRMLAIVEIPVGV